MAAPLRQGQRPGRSMGRILSIASTSPPTNDFLGDAPGGMTAISLADGTSSGRCRRSAAVRRKKPGCGPGQGACGDGHSRRGVQRRPRGGMRAYSTRRFHTLDCSMQPGFDTVCSNSVKANGGGVDGPAPSSSIECCIFNAGYGGLVGRPATLLAFGLRIKPRSRKISIHGSRNSSPAARRGFRTPSRAPASRAPAALRMCRAHGSRTSRSMRQDRQDHRIPRQPQGDLRPCRLRRLLGERVPVRFHALAHGSVRQATTGRRPLVVQQVGSRRRAGESLR